MPDEPPEELLELVELVELLVELVDEELDVDPEPEILSTTTLSKRPSSRLNSNETVSSVAEPDSISNERAT